MKKTIILMLAASLLLTSCDLGGLIKDLEESSSDSSTSTSETNISESSNSDSSSDTSRYDDYKDYEWYNIGLEKFTNYLGYNMHFEALIEYETLKKGKYLSDNDTYGHYNLYICENGDVVYDDLKKIVLFDKSEYQYTTCTISERSYVQSAKYLEKRDILFSFYFELSAQLSGIIIEQTSFTDKKFATLNDVLGLYGMVIEDRNTGSAGKDDENIYICKRAYGPGTSYDETYVFSRYMNCNSMFKYAGLPPFLSTSNITSWDYKRDVSTSIRGKRVWHDNKLYIELEGYTVEDAKTWGTALNLASYTQVSCQNKLDDEDFPYYSYEGTIEIMGFASNHSTKTGYIKNVLKLGFNPYRFDANNKPTDFYVSCSIEYAGTAFWDGAGNFSFEDSGLIFYYTNEGMSMEATIVNTGGELQTSSIIKGKDTVLTFFFPHPLVND